MHWPVTRRRVPLPSFQLLSERSPGWGSAGEVRSGRRSRGRERPGCPTGSGFPRSAQQWSLSPAGPPPGPAPAGPAHLAPAPRPPSEVAARAPAPPLTSASLEGLRDRGLLWGSARLAASSATSSTRPRRSPARSDSPGMVSLPAQLRTVPPRLASVSRASVPSRPASPPAGGAGARRSQERGGAALFSGQRPGPPRPFPPGRLLGARGQSRRAGDSLWSCRLLPFVPVAVAALAPGEFLAGGRRGGPDGRLAPAPRGRSCGSPTGGRADGTGTRGPPGPGVRRRAEAPRGRPQLLGRCLFTPRGRFARGGRPGSLSPKVSQLLCWRSHPEKHLPQCAPCPQDVLRALRKPRET